MKRRDFITELGGAAATWPLAAGAQQPMPVIGFLNGGSADGYAHARDGFLQGLKEADYIVDQNVALEYRWAEGEYDRLPALAADLLRRQVAVLVVNNAATPAAKAATAKIPIVFASGGDPVRSGLVTSLNRPSSNVTGVYFLIDALATKNLHLLHQLVPTAKVMGVLKNPNNPNMESETSGLEAAASSFGCQLQVVNASACASDRRNGSAGRRCQTINSCRRSRRSSSSCQPTATGVSTPSSSAKRWPLA